MRFYALIPLPERISFVLVSDATEAIEMVFRNGYKTETLKALNLHYLEVKSFKCKPYDANETKVMISEVKQ